MRNPDAIRALHDDKDRLAAMAYLAEKSVHYPPDTFIPPWQRQEGEGRHRPFVALHMHASYDDDTRQHRLDTLEYYDGEAREVCHTTDADELAAFMARHVLHHTRTTHLVVTDGGEAGSLDVWLESIGQKLVALGYTIEPCMARGGITWTTIRKGKRRWEMTSAETMTGLPLRMLLRFAGDAGESVAGRTMPAWLLHTACGAYDSFLLEWFGSALRPTVGMIASASARRCMPEDVRKWRPLPLLVAMEREGIGYRGGVTYEHKHRGEWYQIDVNRQYTALLEQPLPLSSMFGRYKGVSSGQHGVFVCTVRSDVDTKYPIGMWQGEDTGFVRGRILKGSTVTVLHTSEFEALQALGCDIETGYGFIFDTTFTLSEYVEKIRAVVQNFGRTAPQGMATKPLGNMLYGKFGQKADRWQLAYSETKPDDSWHPYANNDRRDVPWVWEKQVRRHSMGMHVEIAAHMTGYARSQTMVTVALLESLGLQPVRAHTDSITTVHDPREVMDCDDETIGAWKFVKHGSDGIVVHANAFADDDEAHIAGFREVPRSVLEEMHAGGEVLIAREVNLPREGWYRKTRTVEHRLMG